MRSRSAVETGLRSKGFIQSDGDHHFFIYYTLEGVKSRLRTKTSHSGKDIGKPLFSQMAKQCGLTAGDFTRLVDCPLSREDYEVKVKAKL
jgi:ribulose kinase